MKLIDLVTSPWAITPERLSEIQGIYTTHLRGEKIDIESIEARLGRPLANDQQEYSLREGGVAVLTIDGVIAPKANLFTRVSGGVSAQMATRQVESAIADPRVKALILAIDSPGGSVFGTPELAAAVRELSAIKPIVSVTDGMMASAAYWIGSAANAVFATGPTVQVGSIGVVASHSHTPPQAGGARVTEITAGRYKRMAGPNAPLSEEGAAYIQGQVDHMYEVFVDAVAEHRGTTTQDVLSRMADGRIFIGSQALEAGLIDGFATVDAIAEQLAQDPGRYATRRRAPGAQAQTPAIQQAAGALPVDLPNAAEPVLLQPSATAIEDKPMPITREQLAADAPDVLAGVLADGAAQERARIQAVLSQTLPGHEALVQALAFDGKTTGPEAASAVLAAERAARTAQFASMTADAPAVVPVVPSATVQPTEAAQAAQTAQAAAARPVEERCAADWQANAALHAEFGTLAAYTAYTRASESGAARVFRK